MIEQKIMERVEHAPLEERLRVIEQVMASIRRDMRSESPRNAPHQPFRVRTLSLGQDVEVDRDRIHGERGM